MNAWSYSSTHTYLDGVMLKQRDTFTFQYTLLLLVHKTREFKICALKKPREMGQAVLVLSSIQELSVKISITILTELLLGFSQSLQANYIHEVKLCLLCPKSFFSNWQYHYVVYSLRC
jgi:hypothetical protein